MLSVGFLGCSSSIPKETELQAIELQNKKIKTDNEFQFASVEESQLIAPGDLIQLSYTHDVQLNGKFRVNFEGYLNLPYSIKEYVVGLELNQLKTKIKSRYTHLYQNVDEIKIQLRERKRWVQIAGDVASTGNRLVDVNANITQILAQKDMQASESVTQRKNLKYLKIKFKNSSLIIDLKKYFNNEYPWDERKWHGGEILSFQSHASPDDGEFPMVRVMGEVSEPGSYELESGIDFYSYILKAGGIKPTANIEHVYLIRGGQFQRQIVEMSLDEINRIGKPQPNDTIVLFQDRSSTTERQLQMAASVASILSALAILGAVF
jgi:protein involved in polysaccharide export with SLBB domain